MTGHGTSALHLSNFLWRCIGVGILSGMAVLIYILWEENQTNASLASLTIRQAASVESSCEWRIKVCEDQLKGLVELK